MPSPTPESWTLGWSTPRRPAGSSTGSTATRSRPSCGARFVKGCRPAASSQSRLGWSLSASASEWRSSRRPIGTSRRTSRPARARNRSPRGSPASTAARSPRAGTSVTTGGSKGRPSSSTRPPPGPSRRGCGQPRSLSPRSPRSPTRGVPLRPSRRRRCSRRHRASCECRPSTRCGSRSGSTRTATSPICGPTRSPFRGRPCLRRGDKPATSTAPTMCPGRRGSTPPR